LPQPKKQIDPRNQAYCSPGGFARFVTRGQWIAYPYLDLLDFALSDLAFSDTPRNLLINMPPRHGKSTLASRYFPAWYTGHFPDRRVLLASYEGNFAASWGTKAMDEAKAWGEYLFGIKVRMDVCAASNWQYQGREGGMSTAGVGGPFTGKGGHVLIVDDPIKNDQEARSLARRDLVWDWFTSTALTRLEPNGSIIIIQTRWNEDDLTGRILKEMGHLNFNVLSFPAVAEDEDVLGREKGRALCPERFDEVALAAIKRSIGDYWFGALYQQRPRPEGGNIFKESWFNRYVGEPPGDLIRRLQIIDSAHKTKKENDYSTITTLDLMTAGIYLRHVWREKCTYPDLKAAAGRMFESWGADELCIEDKDAGAMLIQEFQRDTVLPIIPIQADKDKVTRSHAATPLCESGRVWIPADGEAAWLEDWLREILGFPNAQHDDQVDGFVHGLNRLKELGLFVLDPEQILVETGNRSIARDYESPR
jgi:predicted phage terminase large subunit-like protein